MAKLQNSVSLAPEVWVQVDDLIPAYGESRGEVIAHALNAWWTEHDTEIQARKARIAALKPKVDQLIRAESQRDKKRSKKPQKVAPGKR